MNAALQGLVDEHRVIEEVLDVLVAFLDEASAAGGAARRPLAAFATFFRDYADGIHHHKEETLLFGRLLRDGDLAECGPVNRYLAEHNLGRDAVRSIARTGAGSGPLVDDELAAVTEAVRGYAGMLRNHIAREDHELFPAAERVLPRRSADELVRECRRYDRDPKTVRRRERCLELAIDLRRQFPPGRLAHGENR